MGKHIPASPVFQPLLPDDLRRFVAEQAIAAELIDGLGDTPTVPAAAAALGVATDQIIKTLLFLVERRSEAGANFDDPVVVISNGEQRVDKGRLAAHCGVGKKKVNLAPATVVLDLLGYPAGGVPPFGHRTHLPVLVDASILALRERFAGVIYGGGGDDRTMLRLTVDELLRVTQGEVVALSEDRGFGGFGGFARIFLLLFIRENPPNPLHPRSIVHCAQTHNQPCATAQTHAASAAIIPYQIGQAELTVCSCHTAEREPNDARGLVCGELLCAAHGGDKLCRIPGAGSGRVWRRSGVCAGQRSAVP